jgi:pimeloyl-ACP methyl ester carboxylesterase
MTSMTALMKDDAKVRDFLSRVRAPTLLVWSQDDPVLPPKTVETMASRLTGAKVDKVLLENVSHYPPLEAPREVAEATDAFLTKTLGSAGTPAP